MQLEKAKAEEVAAQMAMQAQALMDERMRIRAENESLARNHDMLQHRLAYLESMLHVQGSPVSASVTPTSGSISRPF